MRDWGVYLSHVVLADCGRIQPSTGFQDTTELSIHSGPVRHVVEHMIGNNNVDERSLLQTKSPGWNYANTYAAS